MGMRFVRNNNGFERVMAKARRVLVQTAQAMCDDVKNSGTMPFRSGHLQNNATTVDVSGLRQGRVAIVSDTPYARRKYFNPQFDFNTSVNSQAGGRWFVLDMRDER